LNIQIDAIEHDLVPKSLSQAWNLNRWTSHATTIGARPVTDLSPTCHALSRPLTRCLPRTRQARTPAQPADDGPIGRRPPVTGLPRYQPEHSSASRPSVCRPASCHARWPVVKVAADAEPALPPGRAACAV